MSSSEEVDRKTGALPNESSPDSPKQARYRSGRSAIKKAAARCRASRRASRRKRAHHRATGEDVVHVGTIEPEATRQTPNTTPPVTSATSAQSLRTDSPSQQGPSRNPRSSLGLPGYATASNVEPRARSLVSQVDKSPVTELNMPRKTFQPRNSKSSHLASSDTKGFRGEYYAESSASPTKETPGSETPSPCRESEPLNPKGGRQIPGRSRAAYAHNRHAPDSASPSVLWDYGCNRQFSKQETSLTELINGDIVSNDVKASEANPSGRPRPRQGTPRAPSRRRSVFMDIGSPDETLLARSKSFLFFWRLGSSEGYSADSPRWDKSRRRQASSSPATSIDNSHLSKASRTTLFTALLIPCAVVGIIALLLIRAHPKSTHVKNALWIEQLANACVTVDCYSAVWELSSSIDLFADPCKDFYSFACGRWENSSSAAGGDAKRHNNYMAIQRRAYVAAVNASLLKMRRLDSSMVFNNIAQHINGVYRSCLSFVEEEPVDLRETLRASGIHISFWMVVTTFEDLFAVAVRHALFYNMTTAIDIRWVRDPSNVSTPGTLEISPGLSMAQRIGSSSRRSFISRALPVITSYSTTDQIDALESIDDNLAMWSSMCSQTEVTEMSLWELDTPATNWSLIVGEYAKLTGGKEPPSKARVSNLPDVRVILEVLANSSLPDLKMYLMLVPMSHFFGLEDDIQRQKLVSVDDARGNVKYETCVRSLELLFGDRYRSWVSIHVHRPGTTTDVHRIWEEVLQAARSLIQSLRNIHTQYHNMSAPPTGNGARYPGSTIFSSQQSGEPAALPSEYSDDFVSNVILFSQKSPYGSRSKCEPFLSRESLIMKWTDPETFIRLLVPDFYHPEATEVVVNYATVGYFLGELAFRAELPKKWNESEYGSCMARYVRARLGVVPPQKQWRQLIERRWAAQSALRAAATRHAQVYANAVLVRLFFLRLEHTCCALADRDDVSDSGELRTTCDVVAMTVPRFAEAFGCQNLPEMNC